jgi:hypothetical protein
LSFVSFLCCFCLHMTEYKQMGGGKFSWALGRKIPKYGPGPRPTRSGFDNITSTILKAWVSLIRNPLIHIYNHSLYTSIFPHCLNCRPIASISILRYSWKLPIVYILSGMLGVP